MAEHVLMIALSPTMEEGTIVSWAKKPGDSVAAGDILCEVETDKATMEYESAQEGTLLAIIREDGSSARVGDAIAVIGEEGEDISSLLVPGGDTASDAEPSGEASTGTGSSGAAPSPGAASTGDRGTEPGSVAPRGEAGGSAPEPDAPADSGGRIKASPLARRLAERAGLDLSRISGSGPGGRVVKKDIDAADSTAKAPTAPAGPGSPASAAAQRAQAETASISAAPRRPSATAQPAAASVRQAAPAGTAAGSSGEDVYIPVAGKRAVIAKRTAQSMAAAPHYYLKNSVRMDRLIEARAVLNKETGSKVGFNAFIIKFTAEALKRHRIVNAGWEEDRIVQWASVDIGLAVDLGNGLITPVVRDAGSKGIAQIDAELKDLIARAGENALKPEEYSGNTFTISNLGSFGIEEFTAIINQPASAILALGEIKKTPVFTENGTDGAGIEAAQIMKMTLSCDHRVIDGAAGGRFLSELKSMMENPVRVLF